MMKSKLYILPLCAGLTAAPFAYGQQAAVQFDTTQGENQIESSMAKKVAMADYYVSEANKLSSNEEHLRASSVYLKAIALLKECNTESAFIAAKLESVGNLLEDNYTALATEKLEVAAKLIRTGNHAEAAPIIAEAKKISTSDEIIKRSREMTLSMNLVQAKDIKALDKNFQADSAKIDLALRRGKVLYKNKEYEKAYDMYQEVLVLDPYNNAAIKQMRIINEITREAGRIRTEATIRGMEAEQQWASVTPVKLIGEREAQKDVVVNRVDQLANIKDKLTSIKFPHIEYDELSITAVVKHLKQQSKLFDKENGTGVNIFLRLADSIVNEEGKTVTADVPTVTMTVDNLTLMDAIKFVCQSANLKYRIEKFAVVIADQRVAWEELETRIYPINQDVEINADDPKAQLVDLGVSFGTVGSKAVYDATINRLIVTNTAENLAKLEALMSELNVGQPQVVIETKFIEISQDDLDEASVNTTFQFVDNENPENSWVINSGFRRNDNFYDSATGVYDSSADLFHYDKNDAVSPYALSADNPTAVDPTYSDSELSDGYEASVYNDAGTPTDYTDDSFTGDSQHYAVDTLIRAVSRAESTNNLAAPKVTTLSGQTATIEVFEETYYPVSYQDPEYHRQEADTDDNARTFVGPFPEFATEKNKEGIRLEVTPEVDLETGVITLEISPEIRKQVGTDTYDLNDTNVQGLAAPISTSETYYRFQVRSVTTKVALYDGGTIILGGVISDGSTQVEDKIPILGDIPLIGRAFRQEYDKKVKTNLLIFLTARLINPDGSMFNEPFKRGLPRYRR